MLSDPDQRSDFVFGFETLPDEFAQKRKIKRLDNRFVANPTRNAAISEVCIKITTVKTAFRRNVYLLKRVFIIISEVFIIILILI